MKGVDIMSDNRYRNDYNRSKYKAYTLRLRYDEDSDLIAYMETRGDSPQNVIKKMLRRSLAAYRRSINETEGNHRDESEADQRIVIID